MDSTIFRGWVPGLMTPCNQNRSPNYGFETKADLFFDLPRDFPNLIGFKEFGGEEALR